MSPSEGRRSPAASFRDSVFPVPVSPSNTSVSRSCTSNDTPRKMSPSSKPMRTLSNLMAGWESLGGVTALFIGPVPAIIAAFAAGAATKRSAPRSLTPGPGRPLEEFVREIQRHFGEKRIGDDDHHGRQHGRLRRGPAHALRATAHRQPFVAANGRQDEGEKKRLHKSLHQIRKIQSIDRAPPEFDGAEAQRENRSHAAPEQTHEIGHGR